MPLYASEPSKANWDIIAFILQKTITIHVEIIIVPLAGKDRQAY